MCLRENTGCTMEGIPLNNVDRQYRVFLRAYNL